MVIYFLHHPDQLHKFKNWIILAPDNNLTEYLTTLILILVYIIESFPLASELSMWRKLYIHVIYILYGTIQMNVKTEEVNSKLKSLEKPLEKRCWTCALVPTSSLLFYRYL